MKLDLDNKLWRNRLISSKVFHDKEFKPKWMKYVFPDGLPELALYISKNPKNPWLIRLLHYVHYNLKPYIYRHSPISRTISRVHQIDGTSLLLEVSLKELKVGRKKQIQVDVRATMGARYCISGLDATARAIVDLNGAKPWESIKWTFKDGIEPPQLWFRTLEFQLFGGYTYEDHFIPWDTKWAHLAKRNAEPPIDLPCNNFDPFVYSYKENLDANDMKPMGSTCTDTSSMESILRTFDYLMYYSLKPKAAKDFIQYLNMSNQKCLMHYDPSRKGGYIACSEPFAPIMFYFRYGRLYEFVVVHQQLVIDVRWESSSSTWVIRGDDSRDVTFPVIQKRIFQISRILDISPDIESKQVQNDLLQTQFEEYTIHRRRESYALLHFDIDIETDELKSGWEYCLSWMHKDDLP